MCFENPLPKHTKVDYYECLAKLTLETLFPEKYFELTIKDKPDLQSSNYCLGVEVTKASETEILDHLYVDYNQNRVRCKSKTLKQIEEKGGKILESGVLLSKSKDSLSLILSAHSQKLSKLNSKNYRDMEETNLFIFSEIYLYEEMLLSALNNMVENSLKYNQMYKNIYVSVPNYLYIFDIIQKKYQKIDIDSKLQFDLAYLAREMVEEQEQNK